MTLTKMLSSLSLVDALSLSLLNTHLEIFLKEDRKGGTCLSLMTSFNKNPLLMYSKGIKGRMSIQKWPNKYFLKMRILFIKLVILIFSICSLSAKKIIFIKKSNAKMKSTQSFIIFIFVGRLFGSLLNAIHGRMFPIIHKTPKNMKQHQNT